MGWRGSVVVLLFPTAGLNSAVMDQFKAARVGDLQELRLLLTRSNVGNVQPRIGLTALCYAAANGRADCVNYCLEVHADPNVSDNVGKIPLHYASTGGHVEVVRILLDAGSLIDSPNCVGLTPLHFAILDNRYDVARILLDRGAKLSTVLWDTRIPKVPDWVTAFIASRSRCRYAAITIIGIHKYHRTNVTGNNDSNVLKLIGMHIWSCRMVKRSTKQKSKNK
jgi:ankyrin repeat protein